MNKNYQQEENLFISIVSMMDDIQVIDDIKHGVMQKVYILICKMQCIEMSKHNKRQNLRGLTIRVQYYIGQRVIWSSVTVYFLYCVAITSGLSVWLGSLGACNFVNVEVLPEKYKAGNKIVEGTG